MNKFLRVTVITVLVVMIPALGMAQKRSSDVVELTVWNMPTEADKLHSKVWNDETRDFQTRNPRVRIKGISREYKPQEFVSVMASGKGPDIVHIPISAVPVMAKYGFLSKMNEFVDGWMQKDYMPPIMWNAVTINGDIFAVPHDSFFTTLFYNKEIFEKCGIAEGPKNWSDIIKISEIVRKKMPGVRGIALSPDMFYFIDFIWQAGGDVYKNGQISLNNPSVIKALQFWHDLKWKYQALPEQSIMYEPDVEQLFSTGKVAMMLGVAKRLPVMSRRYGLDISKVEIIPLPEGPTGIQAWHAGGEAFVINKEASEEKKREAWEYIKGVMSPPRQLWKFMRMKELKMIIFPGDFSCATNLINMPEFKNVKGLLEFAQAEPPLYEWPMIKEDFNRYVLEKIFINKKVDFQQVMFEFDRRMKEEYYGR